MSKHSLFAACALIFPILLALSSCHQASSYEIYTGAGGGGSAGKGGGAGQAGSLEAGADSGGTAGEVDEEAAGTGG